MSAQTFTITLYDHDIAQLRRVTDNFNAGGTKIPCPPEEFLGIVVRAALDERCARLDERAKIDQLYADFKSATAAKQQERAQ